MDKATRWKGGGGGIGEVSVRMDSTSVGMMKTMKEDGLSFEQKERVVPLTGNKARFGRSTDIDDVIGIVGECK